MRIGFIGLGVMGGPMAGHLQRAGHDVAVFNRTASRAEAWVGEYGGRAVAHAARGRGRRGPGVRLRRCG